MKQRLISAFFGIILFIIVIFSPVVVVDVCVLLLIEMALHELLTALKLNEYKITYLLSMLFPIVTVLTRYFTSISQMNVVYIYILVMLATTVFKYPRYKFTHIASSLIAAVFITTSLLLIPSILRMDNGIINLFLVFIGGWITDTCAYFSGKAFGKHKLAPQLSPNKTIEGSVGGVVGVMIVFAVYALIVSNINSMVDTNILNAVILGLICGGVSQIGDLCASAIKRDQNIKDFGKLMPGHGGVMDRFDSVLFTAPAVYFFITNFPVFF